MIKNSLRTMFVFTTLATALASGEVRGLVITTSGLPVVDAIVAITPTSPNPLSDVEHAARVGRTDAKGQFTLVALPSGNYVLTINFPGFEGIALPPMSIPAVATVEGVEIKLKGGGIPVWNPMPSWSQRGL